jgi:hypothetical protein
MKTETIVFDGKKIKCTKTEKLLYTKLAEEVAHRNKLIVVLNQIKNNFEMNLEHKRHCSAQEMQVGLNIINSALNNQ